jgi:DNA-binding NarL/FixJ family response regulator
MKPRRGRRDSAARAGFQLAGMRGGGCGWDAAGMTLRLLIVDDSPRFLQAARGLLERQGLTVVGVASDSQQALRQVEAQRPDVTLVDLDLGGESGFALVRRLHQEAGLAPGEVILISTHDPDDFAELITASPAIGFLSKSDLSASAILDLLGRGDDDRAGGSQDE